MATNKPTGIIGPSYRARIAGPSETKAQASSWFKRRVPENSKASGEKNNSEELARPSSDIRRLTVCRLSGVPHPSVGARLRGQGVDHRLSRRKVTHARNEID
jgi:hypothetical protein